MAISHINGIAVSGISHRNGITKANISAINGISAGFGGGGGGTITWESIGNVGGSGTSESTSFPASIAVGDLLLYFISQKPSSSGGGSIDTPPSGFILLGSKKGTSQGSVGTDSGDSNLYVYYKEAAGTESGNIAFTFSGDSANVSVIHRLSKSGGTWSLAIATGEQSTTGNVNVTATTDPGVQAGDYVLCHKVSPTDVTGATAYASGAFSQSGVTFGAVTQANNSAGLVFDAIGIGSSSGSDIGGCIHRAAVTAGTSSGNPTFTATVTGANHGIGPIAFVRVRLT